MLAVILDIETTGFKVLDKVTGRLADSSEILEVGYIRCDTDTGEIYSSGTLYFYKPYFRVESDAQKIHGIQRSFLEQYEDDFDMNLVALSALTQETCIIGKNSNGFDIPFIKEFIIKHSNDSLNIARNVYMSKIKLPEGGYLSYDSNLFVIDVQEVFAPVFRELHYTKNKEKTTRKGRLGEYIDVLDAKEEVDAIYQSLKKERETEAHGALYDVVMTYVVWNYCRVKELY